MVYLSHDTFNPEVSGVLQIIEPNLLRICLGKDGKAFLNTIKGKLINFDGKKIKGENPRSRGNKGLYILIPKHRDWVSENRLCIRQNKVKAIKLQQFQNCYRTIVVH